MDFSACCNRSRKRPAPRRKGSQRQSVEGRAASGWAQRRRRTAEGGDEVRDRCAEVIRTSLGVLHAIANRQLVSRRLILKYSMYTMIQALELRTTAGHARLSRGIGERVHGATDFTSVLHPGRTEKRDNDSPPHSVPGSAERATTVQPTLLPMHSGKYPRGKSVRTRRSLPTRKRVGVAVHRPIGSLWKAGSLRKRWRTGQTVANIP